MAALLCASRASRSRVCRSRDRLERIANSISRHFNRPGVSLIKSSLSRFPAIYIYIYIFRFLSGRKFARSDARVNVPREIDDCRSLEEGVYDLTIHSADIFFVRMYDSWRSRRPFSSFLTAIYSNRVEIEASLSVSLESCEKERGHRVTGSRCSLAINWSRTRDRGSRDEFFSPREKENSSIVAWIWIEEGLKTKEKLGTEESRERRKKEIRDTTKSIRRKRGDEFHWRNGTLRV